MPGIGKSRLLLELRQRLSDTASWEIEGALHLVRPVHSVPAHRGYAEARLLHRGHRGAEADVIGEKFSAGGVDRHGRRRARGGEAVPALPARGRGGRRQTPRCAAMDPVLPSRTASWPPSSAWLRPGRAADVPSCSWWRTRTGSRPRVRRVPHRTRGHPARHAACWLVVTYRSTYRQPFGATGTNQWRGWRFSPWAMTRALGHRARGPQGLGVSDLPPELAATIEGEKAEGNPFFLEEIGRALVETGAVHAREGTLVLARAASAITVPETVQDVIAARLDRLDEGAEAYRGTDGCRHRTGVRAGAPPPCDRRARAAGGRASPS